MPRYKLRTLLIVLALGPALIWGAWALWPPPEPEQLPMFRDDIQYVADPEWKLPEVEPYKPDENRSPLPRRSN